jgi:hypothetical protein
LIHEIIQTITGAVELGGVLGIRAARRWADRVRLTPSDPEGRVRHDRVAEDGNVTLRHNGQLHHIAVGRRLTGARITPLVADADARIIDAATGELYPDLILDPSRDYERFSDPRPPTTPNPTTARHLVQVRAVRDVLRHHIERVTGIEPAQPAWKAARSGSRRMSANDHGRDCAGQSVLCMRADSGVRRRMCHGCAMAS